ncbi:MAG: type II secretion system protein [Bdellovibrionaceae bacterium]|jgi:type II secretory pathway pseudopilin PulG|nr:type II secretion system protein [Pseudobdellovibrionaceae bacterium]
MTLIEIMVVLVILGGLTGAMLSRLKKGGKSNRSFLMQMGNLSKKVRSTSQLTNTTFRMVIDFGDPNDKNSAHQYWVESSTKPGINFSSDDTLDPEELKLKLKEEKDFPPPKFQRNSRVLPVPIQLPAILEFEDVEIKSEERPVTSGRAYIYFLPQGLVDETLIHFKTHNKKQWTLAIHPLTGHISITGGYISMKDTEQ